MAQKTTNNRKNYNFTTKQKAAFALAAIPFDTSSDVSRSDFQMRVETQHFYNLMTKGVIYFDDELREEVATCLVHIRNYTSHATHADLEPLSETLRDFYGRLEMRARHMILDRTAQGKNLNEDASNYLKELVGPLFPLSSDTKINDLSQAEIAFLMAPFLGSSELEFLLGKIFFGKDAYREEDGKKVDIPEVAAKKALMRILAAPDKITVRHNNTTSDTWLEPKYEQPFAIYDLAKRKQESGDMIFADQYVMKELLRFIRFHKILPDFTFARVKTISTRDETVHKAAQLMQETTFCDDDAYPYQIKFNTIIGENKTKNVRGMFNLRLSMHIVAYYLKNEGKSAEIQEFVTNWLCNHHDYSHRKKKEKIDTDLDKSIVDRCQHWRKKDYPYLQQKIRFISDKINHAWRCQYGESLSKDDYLRMQDSVRYYNKEALRSFSTEPVWTKTGIGLGRGDNKSLGKCITKEDLTSVFKELLRAWHGYLEGIQEGLHKRTDEEKQLIAKILGVRLHNNKEEILPCFPVGMPPKVFVEAFFEGKGSEAFYRSLPTIWKGADLKDTRRGKDADWFKSFLLVAMASHILSDFGSLPNKRSDTLPYLSKHEITIRTEGDYFITLMLGKAWRKYAKIHPKNLQVYLHGERKVPLLKANETKEGISIESAVKKCEAERYIFIQACLQWELNMKKEHRDRYNKLLQKETGYVPFKDLCEEFKVQDITSLRHDALHGRISRFSECGAPINKIYNKIEEKRYSSILSRDKKGKRIVI